MDETVEPGMPVIGYMLRQSLEADEVASYLEMVAACTRRGHLLGFELKWQAGSEAIEANIYPRTPAKFVNVELAVSGNSVS